MGHAHSACPMATPSLQSVYSSTKCLRAVSWAISSNDETKKGEEELQGSRVQPRVSISAMVLLYLT